MDHRRGPVHRPEIEPNRKHPKRIRRQCKSLLRSVHTVAGGASKRRRHRDQCDVFDRLREPCMRGEILVDWRTRDGGLLRRNQAALPFTPGCLDQPARNFQSVAFDTSFIRLPMQVTIHCTEHLFAIADQGLFFLRRMACADAPAQCDHMPKKCSFNGQK